MQLFGIDLPPGRDVQGWDDWPVNAKQFALDSAKSWGLSKIINIRAHLHRVVFCSCYVWGDFHGGPLGSLHYFNTEHEPEENGYCRISAPNESDTECLICTHPTQGYLPQSIIVFVGPRAQKIGLFHGHYSEAWVSSVEYALDMICANPSDARNLFNLLKRYLYVSNLQQGGLIQQGENDNRTIYYGKYKLYERGPDHLQMDDGGWSVDHIDRVRWEFSADVKDLNKRGIFFVFDLLLDPNFDQITRLRNQKRRFGFGKFADNHPYLKKEWDWYYPTADHQIGHCFQEEYFHQRRKLSEQAEKVSISDYRVSADGFGLLVSGIDQAIQEFEQSWEQGTYEPCIECQGCIGTISRREGRTPALCLGGSKVNWNTFRTNTWLSID